MALDAPVMGSIDPRLEVREDEMNHREMRFGLIGIATEDQGIVPVAQAWQVIVASPSIGPDDGSAGDIVGGKGGDVFRGPATDDAQPQSPGIDLLFEWAAVVVLAFSAGAVFGIFPPPHFDSAQDGSLVMHAATLGARPATDQTLINFYGIFAADGFPLRADHARAQLMEDLEGGFITGQAELPLELQRGLAGRLSGNEVSAPKPCGKGRVGGPHHGAGSQRGILLARAAPQDHGASRLKAIGLALLTASGAGEAIRPAEGFQVFFTRLIVGKNLLKLRETGWESAWVHVLIVEGFGNG